MVSGDGGRRRVTGMRHKMQAQTLTDRKMRKKKIELLGQQWLWLSIKAELLGITMYMHQAGIFNG